MNVLVFKPFNVDWLLLKGMGKERAKKNII